MATLLTRLPAATRVGVALAALLAAGCAALPEGVSPAPAGAGSTATLTLPSGRSVDVDPASLRYSGQGELVMADQSRYQGEFRNGERWGWGVLTSADGVYRGEWQRDAPHGEGDFEGADGARYQGGWQDGERSGFGTYVSADGTEYEGDWDRDEPHGFGRLLAPHGDWYVGEWQEGRQNGYGHAGNASGLMYEGTWVSGRKHGFGREVRPDGSRYEGDWVEDVRHGQGRETYADGTVHEGTWELNQPLGAGRRKLPVGIEIIGLWNRDAVSSGLLRLPTGLEYAGPLYSRAGTVASPPLLDWLQRTAGEGDPYAQLLLGTAYLDLHSPPPDVDAARRWLARATEAGIGEAQYRLALTFQNVDEARVATMLSLAAAQGHAGANELLGDYFAAGIGVRRSLQRAIGHYERAVAAGSSTARNSLAWLLATASDARLRDGARAVALIEPIALFHSDWQYLDTLAAAWAAAGDFDQAMTTARQALEAAGLDPVVDPRDLAALERRLERFREHQPLVETPP